MTKEGMLANIGYYLFPIAKDAHIIYETENTSYLEIITKEGETFIIRVEKSSL